MNKIKTADFIEMLISAANNLANFKDKINDLNVFPVPDGDTGTNMLSTFKNSLEIIKKLPKKVSVAHMADIFSKEMLMNAKGNSGIILSQFFKGLAISFKNKSKIEEKEIIAGFIQGHHYAHKSVLKPVKGTILSVLEEIAFFLEKKYQNSNNIIVLFENIKKICRQACDNTINLMEVLKKANVTDSGSEGFYLIIEGMLLALKGQNVQINLQNFAKNQIEEEIFEGEFGYCCEIIVEIEKNENFHQKKYIKKIEKFATSIVLVQDGNILKVHSHILKIHKLFKVFEDLGQFLKVKIDNMQIQARNKKIEQISHTIEKNPQIQSSSFLSYLISIHEGQGFIKNAQKNEVDFVYETDKKWNIDSKEIIDHIQKIPNQNVFIFSNSLNVYKKLLEVETYFMNKKNIFIIPSENQLVGFRLINYFDKNIKSEENLEILTNALLEIKSAKITKYEHVKNSFFYKIKNKIFDGEYVLIFDEKILEAGRNLESIIFKLLSKFQNLELENITIFHGKTIKNKNINKIVKNSNENFELDIEIFNGKQESYELLVCAE